MRSATLGSHLVFGRRPGGSCIYTVWVVIAGCTAILALAGCGHPVQTPEPSIEASESTPAWETTEIMESTLALENTGAAKPTGTGKETVLQAKPSGTTPATPAEEPAPAPTEAAGSAEPKAPSRSDAAPTQAPQPEPLAPQPATAPSAEPATEPPTDLPTEPPAEIDLAALESYGCQIAEGLGFAVDYSLSLENSSYFPGDILQLSSTEEGYQYVEDAIRSTYANLMSVEESISGCRCNVLVEEGDGGNYIIWVLYG